MASLRFLTLTFWHYYVLKLLRLETITFSDATLHDINVVLCYVLSQYRIHSLPPSLSKSGLKLVCNVNIVYENLKSENSQDYAQKPQRNCTFMNSASVLKTLNGLPQEVGMGCTLLNSIMVSQVQPSFKNE